ncbi:NAD-dependent SIR2 family protein deacetylase [Amycolatopsis bartoniae]|uniref:protein acetyllysine N-acetyltransferase n=1 Tax=Amycolatopsis bartoniae TaxID=941986 RepID=A0A8H9J0L8_9PSEU|nr:Sir2 family NAD-dependent protein deacetylase [Amycolatopsis bartoniae]MBB2935122.1 NAD-dependent SIR2 family protein deacetylase [Amycolatopsis bartoniae]GHF74512.1 NAD-dependent protein deacetylase [Amycolatopsis bartoniae]
MSGALESAARLIEAADALLVCAGAGMGVDSGLPDFRGDEGFWRAYPPYERLGLRFAELADPRHFADDPSLAWGFYGHRLELYRATVPHEGFALLRKWGEAKPGGAAVFTSNVDGQFQKAGFALVAEVHGSIHHLQCTVPCGPDIWAATDVHPQVDEKTMRAAEPLPECRNCGQLARPNILMFGDFDWLSARSDEQLRAVNDWRRAHPNLVVVELGAGSAVPTVRRYSELASAATGALVRINPREPAVRHGRGVSLPHGALDTLTALDELLTGG